VFKPVTLRTLPASGLEGEERFQLRLVHVSNGAVISSSHGSSTVIILSDPRLSGIIAVSPHSQVLVVGQPRDGYDGSGHVRLVRNGGKYGRVDVVWQILTSPDSDVFLQTEGIATFYDLDTTTDVYILVIMQYSHDGPILFNTHFSVEPTGWLKIKYPTRQYAMSSQRVVRF